MSVYLFKQALNLGGKDGKDFPKGEHQVEEKFESLENFKRFVKLELIVEVPAGEEKKSEDEIKEKLVKKLEPKRAAKEEAPKEAEVESASEEDKKPAKPKKKKNEE